MAAPINRRYPGTIGKERSGGRELRAVFQGAELKRPLLVGWSVGGVVIENYLMLYGAR